MVAETKPDKLHPLTQYDLLGLQILEFIYASGKSVRRSTLQSKLSRACATIKKRLDRFITDGLVHLSRIPHGNQGMPAAYVYSATGAVSLQEVQAILQVAKQAELPERPEFSSLADALFHLRGRALRGHLEVLSFIANESDCTAVVIAEGVGELKQSTHGRLKRLMKVGVITRLKKTSNRGCLEYHYRLAGKVTKDEVSAMMEMYDIPSTETKPSLPKAEPSVEPPHGNSTLQLLASKLPDFDPLATKDLQLKWFEAYESLIAKHHAPTSNPQLPGGLPPFDPTWSHEAQGDWMAIYRALIEADTSGFTAKKIMEIVNGNGR